MRSTMASKWSPCIPQTHGVKVDSGPLSHSRTGYSHMVPASQGTVHGPTLVRQNGPVQAQQQYVFYPSSGICGVPPAVCVPFIKRYVFYPSSGMCAVHLTLCILPIQQYMCLPSSGMCAVHASAFSFTCRPYGGQLAATFLSATRWRNYPRATTFSLLASNR